MKITFLGTGNMGTALIVGSLKAKVVQAKEIIAYDVNEEALDQFKNQVRVKTTQDLSQAVSEADYIFLCVKPQQMQKLLTDLSGFVTPKQCLVSIAAGITTEKIEFALSHSQLPVVRVMPNTPALIREGASAVCGGRYAKEEHIEFVLKLLSGVGQAVSLSEDEFNAVTAVSGSGPAYVFYLAEALMEAAHVNGLSDKAAQVLVRQTIFGAAKMLMGEDLPQDLRRNVTSPGGTTEAALQHLEAGRWKDMFIDAVHMAKERSQELSKI